MQEARHFKPSTVPRRFSVTAGFYRTCVIDGLLEHSPAEHVRRPAVPAESPTLGFTHLQFEALLTAARDSQDPCDFALVAMLGLLGLRIFEATGADITDLAEEHGGFADERKVAERATLGSGRLTDVLRITRHPLATSLVCVLAAFVAVDGTRRIVDQHARAHHGWAVAVLLALLAYTIAMYVLLSSARGRQRLNFDGARAGSVPVLLLAIAWSSVLLSVALVYFGASTWCLWLTFGVFCVLVGAWYHQVRRARTA
jgi:hypothetical protein